MHVYGCGSDILPLWQKLIPITESEVWNALHLEQTLTSGDMVRHSFHLRNAISSCHCKYSQQADILYNSNGKEAKMCELGWEMLMTLRERFKYCCATCRLPKGCILWF